MKAGGGPEVGSRVEVSVAATSANLGPGFDCFGLALDWRDQVVVEVIEHGCAVEVSGEGADRVPTDRTHLIVSTVLAGLADLGVEVPGLRLRAHNTIPHGRGLGSSSAAIVAGLVAARGLAGLDTDPAWVLRHATAIEGHPDNVAAAAYGGFVLAYGSGAEVRVAQARVDPDISGVVFVPAHAVETRTARSLLPASVPHADAAANSGRAALLVQAFAGEPELLLDATQDRLHQAYRRSAMPLSYELVLELRRRGLAAVISGAGPTVLVLGRRSALGDEVTRMAGPDWVVRQVEIGRAADVIERRVARR